MVRKKNSFFDFKAQGTIEYLIIVAVVIVLSLIIVALVLSSSNNSTAQLIDSSAQMSNVFGGSISASDLVIDSNGNALFKLNNLSGDNVTIKKIIVGGEESAYNDLVPSTGERMIYLADSNTNCVCQENQKNAVCVVEIVYVTREGLEKKETRNLTIDCVNTAAPSQPLQVSGLGSGTIDDPFVINSCKELQRMKDNLDWHYTLGGDINCAETINWNNGLGFEPIGRYGADVNFAGNFDGRGHIISNLLINRPSDRDVGLFGTSNGEISNVGLVNVLIGGDRLVGGLAGISNGSVSNSYVTGSVTGSGNYVGGLVGSCYYGSVSNCFSTGSVTGSIWVGGLVGDSSNGCSVSNCFSTGSVTGSGWVGGLAGVINGCSVSNCFSTGSVTGSSRVGGLVGGLVGASSGSISNSYWDVLSSGQDSCYSGGSVGCTSTMSDGYGYFGGMGVPFTELGFDGNWVARDYNYPVLFWQDDLGGDVGDEVHLAVHLVSPRNGGNVYNEELVTLSFNVYSSEGIDSCIVGMGSSSDELEDISNGVVYDVNFAVEAGEYDWNVTCVDLVGNESQVSSSFNMIWNNYTVNDCVGLQNMKNDLNGNYSLGQDINCYNDTSEGGALYNSGLGFRPIGTSSTRFTGSFNGGGHIISGLNINRPSTDYVGLFGTSTGEISNAKLENVSIKGNRYVGGLAGSSSSFVSNSYVTGSVTGSSYYVGGLVGYSTGLISDSYSTGSVTGLMYTGGLVGYSTGLISNSFSTGNVISTASSAMQRGVGGLVGYLYGGSIVNSFSTGDVNGRNYVGGLVGWFIGSISNSFSTGDVNSIGVTGGLVGYSDGSSSIINNSFSTGSVTSSSAYVGGLVGSLQSGSISNSYWDIVLSGQSSCYKDGNTGCTSTNGDGSDYFGSNGIPFSNLFFDGNWVWSESNYPILSWQ